MPDMYVRARRSNGKFDDRRPPVSLAPGPGWWWPGGGGRRWGRRRWPGCRMGGGEGRGGFTGSTTPLLLSSSESMLKEVAWVWCFRRRVSPLWGFSNIVPDNLMLWCPRALTVGELLELPPEMTPHFSPGSPPPIGCLSPVRGSGLVAQAGASGSVVMRSWGNFQKFNFVIYLIIRTKLHDSLYQMPHLTISYTNKVITATVSGKTKKNWWWCCATKSFQWSRTTEPAK